jgi:hypothetical protein
MSQVQHVASTVMTAEVQERPFRLSRNQQKRWHDIVSYPRQPVHQISPTYLVTGPLDRAALIRAFRDMLARHDILRVRIVERCGEPIAAVRPLPDTFPMGFVDLSGLDEMTAGQLYSHYATREAAVPLDLAMNLPLRALLLRLDEHRHILLMTLSHVVADGWSTGVLVRDLQACYRAVRATADLPSAPTPFATYVDREDERYRSGEVFQHLSWWRDQLAGVSWSLPLGAGTGSDDNGRDVVTLSFELPASFGGQLRHLARESRTTVYGICLAAFAAVLAAWTDTQETLITVPFAGRAYTTFENTIGLFANTLALRINVSPDDTFRQLLRQVRSVLYDALEHADTPFDLIKDELSKTGVNVATPQVGIQTYPRSMCDASAASANDLTFQLLNFRTQALHVELALGIVESDEGPFSGSLYHQTRVMSPREGLSFLALYQELLSYGVAEPDRRVWELTAHSIKSYKRRLADGAIAASPMDANLSLLWPHRNLARHHKQ